MRERQHPRWFVCLSSLFLLSTLRLANSKQLRILSSDLLKPTLPSPLSKSQIDACIRPGLSALKRIVWRPRMGCIELSCLLLRAGLSWIGAKLEQRRQRMREHDPVIERYPLRQLASCIRPTVRQASPRFEEVDTECGGPAGPYVGKARRTISLATGKHG